MAGILGRVFLEENTLDYLLMEKKKKVLFFLIGKKAERVLQKE